MKKNIILHFTLLHSSVLIVTRVFFTNFLHSFTVERFLASSFKPDCFNLSLFNKSDNNYKLHCGKLDFFTALTLMISSPASLLRESQNTTAAPCLNPTYTKSFIILPTLELTIKLCVPLNTLYMSMFKLSLS